MGGGRYEGFGCGDRCAVASGGSSLWYSFQWGRLCDEAETQSQAFGAVLDASRYMDVKYGTSITRDVWQNIMNVRFTAYP